MIAMNMPERWGYVYLSDVTAGRGSERFVYPSYRPIEKLLWAMFYAQEEQLRKRGRYLNSLEDFRLTADELAILPQGAHLKLEKLSSRYLITVEAGRLTMSIDEEGRIWKAEK